MAGSFASARNSIRVLAFALAAGMSIVPIAVAQDRTPVTDARPLMLAALAAIDGAAHGVLVGEMASAIGQRFGSASPIFIDVTTERRYAQAGCSRLKVSFWQDGVRLPGQPESRHQSIDFGINYCRDGSAPKSLT
jgi:hypothetical protein